MLTDKDFEKLLKLFPTGEEFKQELEKIREEMATKDDLRKLMVVLDKVLKEVLDMRQEQTMHVQTHRDIEDEIESVKKKLNQIPIT